MHETQLLIGGIKLYLFNSDTETKKLIIFCLHGRQGSARQCFKLCRHLCSAVEGIVAVTFDSRNHGDRTIDPARNLDWTSNKTFPADMYSMMLGNLYDIQLSINMLPSYIKIENAIFGIVGISLGAHSALLSIANEPRLKFVISVLGCTDYEALLKSRSAKQGLSQDLDVSESFGLLLRVHDPICRMDDLINKSILLLGGRNDDLVPPSLNAHFIEIANQKNIDCEEIIDDNAGHELTYLMRQKITEWLQKRF